MSYKWEGDYKLPGGREVTLAAEYSWGDPDTGISAGIEEVKAFDDDGKEIPLSESEVDHIVSDTVLAERIEDNAADEYTDYMEGKQWKRR